jgi:hypothetical protein
MPLDNPLMSLCGETKASIGTTARFRASFPEGIMNHVWQEKSLDCR